MHTRRRFLALTAAGMAGIGAGSFAQVSTDAFQRTKPDVIIYEGKYPGWPWITAGASGTLYCVWREGTEHMFSAEGRVMLATSSDKGRTWSSASVIVDEPGVDDRNVAIVELPNGELLLSYNSYTRDEVSLAMTARSGDGGKTWSAPQSVGVPNTRTRSAGVVLSNGDVLLPLYKAPGNGAIAALSYNNGRNWESFAIPDTDGFVGDEWDALELESKHIIGISRNNIPQSDGYFWVTESKDRGKTWSIPQKTNVQSQRFPSPPQLSWHGNTPTLVYSDQRMVSVSAVKTSDPTFVSWDLDSKGNCYQYMADGSAILDGSYPCSVQVAGKVRLIIDYEIRTEGGRISGYYVTFPDSW
ncbi:MAG: sialidase family protein [Candidatus Hydrogenedentes bacterium]|nr:sialidase family protein [Candidatus Hydrogenedentota bacterium]